jgi:3-ketosteroid 9alpha-monooxygenase subunit A
VTSRAEETLPEIGTSVASTVPPFEVHPPTRTFQERGFPYQSFPTGWFQIGWSEEFPVGEARPLFYFATDLVAFRGTSGEVHVLDAHCQHLGAHLGYGGTVVGDDVQCPFHGWQWDAAGVNVDIPYSAGKCSRRRLRPWIVRENSGAVFVWHHPDGSEPSWELPDPLIAESADPTFHQPYPHAVHAQEVAIAPQWVAENIVDAAHVKYVHRWPEVPSCTYSIHDHMFSTVIEGGMETSRGAVSISAHQQAWGVGIIEDDFKGLHPMRQLECVTPIDHGRSHFRFSLFVASKDGGKAEGVPSGLAKAAFSAEIDEVFVHDTPIWEHQIYTNRPGFTKEEGEVYGAFRRWAKRFYQD